MPPRESCSCAFSNAEAYHPALPFRGSLAPALHRGIEPNRCRQHSRIGCGSSWGSERSVEEPLESLVRTQLRLRAPRLREAGDGDLAFREEGVVPRARLLFSAERGICFLSFAATAGGVLAAFAGFANLRLAVPPRPTGVSLLSLGSSRLSLGTQSSLELDSGGSSCAFAKRAN